MLYPAKNILFQFYAESPKYACFSLQNYFYCDLTIDIETNILPRRDTSIISLKNLISTNFKSLFEKTVKESKNN